MTLPPSTGGWSRARFVLRLLEVRLRFAWAIGLLVACVAGWPWLQNLWDRARHRAAGHHAHAAVSADTEFFCPMDPGVLSAWPAICPICNMDLVPRKKTDAVLLPAGVVARMQLSPYRIQLAGLRTSPVEVRELSYSLTYSGTLESADGILFLEAPLPAADERLFARSWPASVRPLAEDDRVLRGTATRISTRPLIRIELPDAAGMAAGTVVVATVTIPAGGRSPPSTQDGPGAVLAVPESAVIHRGADQIAYVETMPGMFDAVRVQAGQPADGYVPVLSGLKEGQRVVTAGSFLVDAETRLDPSLAIQYFGAAAQASAGQAPQVRQSSRLKAKLSPEDQKLADAQRLCPVTNLPLDSMGGPLAVQVSGRKVFVCCKGCEGPLRADPPKYLSKLKASP